MDGQSSAEPPQSRPYRSKRHRPCDVCRRRKHACFLQDQPPCRVCRDLGTSCTFNDPPTKRQRLSRMPPRDANITPPADGDADPLVERADATDGQDSEAAEEGAHASIHVQVDQTWLSGADASTSPSAPRLTEAQDHGVHGFQGINDAAGPDILSSSSHDIWFAATTMLDPGYGTVPAPIFTTGTDDAANYLHDPLFRIPNRLFSPSAAVERPFHGNTYHDTESSGADATNGHGVPLQSQPIRSLDLLDGSLTASYLGLSGEMDPYLVRHMRFSEEGSCNFGQFQYRRLAPGLTRTVANNSRAAIPVQFMISAPKPLVEDDSALESEEKDEAAELNRLVSPEIGVRLVGLFLRYVFPSLPVLSRTRLEINSEVLTPKAKHLATHPSYLLAAVYATAYMYRRYDPVLTVSHADKAFPQLALWSIAYRGILRSIHIPRLATIQALLIYLQRAPDQVVSASTDSPGHWPLLGATIHAANQLGLHIDCATWSIPTWERRLRRRLWWSVYSEATWRSLLLGLPQSIQSDQWDISALKEDDFQIDHFCCPSEQSAAQEPALQTPCPFCHLGHDFRFLAELSLIAHDVYRSFYTLRATRRLAHDYNAALEASRPLLIRLEEWHAQIPAQMQVTSTSQSENRDYFHPGSAANLKLAYLTLKTLVFRAILRPLANTVAEEPGSSEARNSSSHQKSSSRATGWDVSSMDLGSQSDALQGALDLVRCATRYARNLGSYDRNSFCYSWSRACFSTISNFIMLLLVLAPNAQSAKEVLGTLAKWVIILREQCIVFDNMQLGILRMDAVFRSGLENAFRFPPHVKESVQDELPTPNYQNK